MVTQYELIAVELLVSKTALHHAAPYLPWLKDAPYAHIFVANIAVPWGNKGFLHTICVWGTRKDLDRNTTPGRMMLDFIQGDEARRNRKIKLIPNLANASWLVASAVGTKPVLIGTKLKTMWHASDRHLEMTIDISSNMAASTAVKLVSGACSSLVIDLAILIESQLADELPENLIGHVRLTNMDLSKAYVLDTENHETWCAV